MDNYFKYYTGSLEEFISESRIIDDNRLMKIQLATSSLPDLPNYSHVLDNFAVHHIIHRHSGKRERLRGQEPVSLSDLLLIPEIVHNYDTCSPVQCKNWNQGLIYTKDFNDDTYILIEEIRKGRSELSTTTLYKKKKKLTDAKSPI